MQDDSSDIVFSATSNIPKHVAIIMDGNGRWAQKRGLPRVAGHKAGVETVRSVIQTCVEKGIEVVTLFAFSSENWRRPEKEVTLLMSLFLMALQREVKKLHKNEVQLRIVGDVSAFDNKIQEQIKKAEALTKDNKTLVLNIAANYGGQWDITQSVKSLARKVELGELKAEDITSDLINKNLCMSDLPEPDLFIRTGGEQRVSNFLIWQLAYSELYFTDTLWPDFDRQAFEEALSSYAGRQRRFGHTGEQIEKMKNA
ncbi:MAG: di-trans,poly-cis-decaprenylcistransferase [Gammaproteobacteria bacterium]|nr:di-trans,poly-cis-decaprenylcistransferase [Gammaproteobacteria bacterium]